MFTKQALNVLKRSFNPKRHFNTSLKLGQEDEHPLRRTLRILRDDFVRFGEMARREKEKQGGYLTGLFPRHGDIVIIGGGAMGLSIAYWLKEKTSRDGIRVIVIEKDPSYSKCSTALSLGGLRQQFSLPENIQMSLFGYDFLRNAKKTFGAQADVHFIPHGYLVLAGEEGAQQLLDNSRLQQKLGAQNRILTKSDLEKRFPWMNVSDVEVGCLGLEKEGWFDPWALLMLLRGAASGMGTELIKAEAVGFNFKARDDLLIDGVEEGNYEGLQSVVIKMPDGEHRTIEFAFCIIAAGSESAEIARQAKVGVGAGMLSFPLPVERRKRYVFRFHCPENCPGINTPMTIDPTGAYFRRDGFSGCFLAGCSPFPEEEPNTDNLDVDHNYFDQKIWPIIANRVPAFNSVKVKNAWSGFYEYNYYDENGIVGPHPYYHNLYIATGFSGHGIQQAPAVGRAIAEMILDGDFQTIDLTRLGFDRLIVDKPMYEIGIY